MTPRARVSAVASAAAIACVVLAFTKILPALKVSIVNEATFKAITALLSATGVYTAVSQTVSWLVLRFLPLKRLFFGKDFIQGTWVGYYEDQDTFCYCVEHFEQDLDGIWLRGISFDRSGAERSAWHAPTVLFDSRLGKLTYSYFATPNARQTIEQGLASFSVVRDNERDAPAEIYGCSQDLIDGHRSPSHEQKSDDHLLAPHAALRLAMAYKEKHDKELAVLPLKGAPDGAVASLNTPAAS